MAVGMIPCINANPNPCPLSPQTKSWDFSKPGQATPFGGQLAPQP